MACFQLCLLETVDTIMYSYSLADKSDQYLEDSNRIKLKTFKFNNPTMPKSRKGFKFIWLQFLRAIAVFKFNYNVIYNIIESGYKFDIVHIHSPLHFIVALWAKRRGSVVFLTIHGTDFYRIRDSRIYQFLLKGVDNINCVANYQCSILKEIFPKKNVYPVSNGVELELFSSRPNEKHNVENKIIAVGTLRWHKNFKCLIEAFSKIHNKHQDWELYIYGEGKDRYDLETYISYMGLSNKVFLPGNIDRKSLSQILKKSKIFVLSSVTEGLPKVLLEAMATGTACVSTDVGDCKYVLGEAGLIIPPNDSNELASALEFLIRNPSDAENLSKQASLKALNYSWESYRELHANLYNKVVLETNRILN